MTSTAATTTAPPLPGSGTGLPPSLPPGFDGGSTTGGGTATTPPATAGTTTSFVPTTTGGGADYKTLPAPGSCTTPPPVIQGDPLQKGGGAVAGASGGGAAASPDLASVLTSLSGVLGQLTTVIGGVSGGGAPGKTDPTQVAGAGGNGSPVQQTPGQVGGANGAPGKVEGGGAAVPPSTVAGANGTPAADASQGAAHVHGGGATADMTGVLQALQAVIAALNSLVQALNTSQVGGVEGGGAPGKLPETGCPPGMPTQVPPSKVDGESGGPVQTPPVKQEPPTKVDGEKGGPTTPPPVKQEPPTKVGGEKGAPPVKQEPPVKQTPPTPPPTQVGGENGGPVQQSPVQQTPPSKVGGENGGPTTPPPVKQEPPKADLGTVKLDNDDSRWSAKLSAANGKNGANSVELWGDPHVVITVDGKEEKFDIGHGAGKVTLFDGTVISWDTYDKGEMHKHGKANGRDKTVQYILSDFKVDSEGTNLDRSVTTRDWKGGTKGDQMGLTTALTEAHLKEFAIALREMKGSWKEPLKNGSWTSPAHQSPTQSPTQVGGANGNVTQK